MSAIPRTFGSTFDHRRNTSHVHPVPPDALRNALSALAALRRSDPELVQWIEDGHPTLTADEHVQRFGAPYQRSTPKRRTAV